MSNPNLTPTGFKWKPCVVTKPVKPTFDVTLVEVATGFPEAFDVSLVLSPP
jgi:hypothetical protein